MKLNLAICFLAVTTLAFAQKREIRDIESAVKSRKFDDAKKMFQAIDENTVEEKYKEDYLYLKGLVLLGNPGNSTATAVEIATAKEAFKETVKLNSSKKDAVTGLIDSANNRLFKIAQGHIENDEFQEAAQLVDLIYKDDTTRLEMLNNAAVLYYSARDFLNAKQAYDQLYAKNYTGEVTYYYAINTENGEKISFPSAKTRDFSLLSKQFSTPTEEKTDSSVGDIILNLVWMYKQDDDLPKAKKLFEEAQGKYPDDISLKLKSADIYLLLEMMDAYEKASNALSNGVTDPSIFDNLAASAQKNEEWDQVIKYYLSSLELKEENFKACVNISNAYIQKGNMDITTATEQSDFYKTALTFLEKANVMMPSHKSVIGTLEQLYGVLNMKDKLAALKAKQ
jgi:tetratricopeptide (TPR) repeat protein